MAKLITILNKEQAIAKCEAIRSNPKLSAHDLGWFDGFNEWTSANPFSNRTSSFTEYITGYREGSFNV